MNRQKALFCLIVIGLLASLGCQEQIPADPGGTWTRTQGSGESRIQGTLELTDGKFFFTFKGNAEGHTDTHGRFSLSGDKITLEGSSCINPGTYSYSVSKTQITFTLDTDTCKERVDAVAGTWTRKN